MDSLKKVFIALLILCTPTIYFPTFSHAQEHKMLAKADMTLHPIESRATVDEEIATDKPQKGKLWLWGLLGAALVGGIAAMAGGGDDGGGGGDNGGGDAGGSATISW